MNIGEVIPFVQLEEETLDYYAYVDDYGYPVVAIYDESSVNLLTDYDDILLDSGYEFYAEFDDYGYDIFMYTKGNVIIQYDYYPGDDDYPAGNEIYVSLLELSETPDNPESEYPDAWPAELIESYFNGVYVPSVPNVTEYLVTDYMDFIGFIVVECAATSTMEEEYVNALREAGFTVEFDTEYGQYFAVESTNSVQVDLYTDGSVFTVILSEPVVELPAEWPEGLINEYYGVSIPAPENVNVLGVVDYYDYDQTIVIEIEGDETTLSAYAELLANANYTVATAENASYGVECIRAINEQQTVRVDLMLSSSSVVIEIGHYTVEDPEAPVDPENPEAPAYNSQSIMEDICVSLFGDATDSYSYDEDYKCYVTTAIFGDYDASTVYSYVSSILPEEIVYAYAEEPIVDSYNGYDEYYNVFFDEAQTVAVEVVCYYYSADYGYVAQICVYNFDDYFTA